MHSIQFYPHRHDDHINKLKLKLEIKAAAPLCLKLTISAAARPIEMTTAVT